VVFPPFTCIKKNYVDVFLSNVHISINNNPTLIPFDSFSGPVMISLFDTFLKIGKGIDTVNAHWHKMYDR
jgi:hypothetical protein